MCLKTVGVMRKYKEPILISISCVSAAVTGVAFGRLLSTHEWLYGVISWVSLFIMFICYHYFVVNVIKGLKPKDLEDKKPILPL